MMIYLFHIPRPQESPEKDDRSQEVQFASQAERSDELGDTLSLGSPWSRGCPDAELGGVETGDTGETTSGAKATTGKPLKFNSSHEAYIQYIPTYLHANIQTHS